ncbi:MAG: flagellar basal-body MS-ring/collar protein FliF [Desulfobacteraceae bacterium]|nr:flagellar basal-body MS-ring/collar protein FliF [Desulfobacteraceae bacterium]
MTETVKKLAAPYMTLPPARRWLVGAVVLLSIACFGTLIMVANRIDYKPLFANLSNEDTGEIVKKLKEQKVPYRIASDGKAILVPTDKVYDLRISLASEGLPQGGGVGFEIFDRKNFGMTEFVQKLNYQRALQGELARTIMQIDGVEHARVHLAIPEKSLFKDNEKPPTASIVLQMKSGRLVRDSEVQGIVHLVASSVEGMDPEQVTVLDSRGKVMSRTGPADITGKMTSTMMETQRSYEKNLEDRLQSLLDKAVGSGKSVARVSAVLNFSQVEKVEERYDPNAKVVRSEQRMEQKDGTTVTTGGIPGVQSNTGKAAPAAPATAIGGSKRDETLNYEINRSSSKIIEPVGNLTKLSVAILVDGKYEAAAAAKSGKESKPKYSPRSPEELQKIEALVKSAVGYSADRGDQLTVVNVPFQESMDDAPVDAPKVWEKPFFVDLGKNLLLGLAFIALLLLVVRPLMKILSTPSASRNETLDLLESQRERMEKIEGGGHGLLPQQEMDFKGQTELLALVKQDPYQTAQVLQNWLRQRD